MPSKTFFSHKVCNIMPYYKLKTTHKKKVEYILLVELEKANIRTMTDETKTALRSREESNSVFFSRVSLLFEKPGNDVR